MSLDPLSEKYWLSRRAISWLLVILIALLYLFPIGLPLKTERYTLDLYEFIEGLGPESKPFIISFDYTVGGKGEVYPSVVAVSRHLMSKKVPLVFMGFAAPEVGPMIEQLFVDVDIEGRWGYVYGEDYINVGYIPGTLTAGAALATDVKAVVSSDIYGNDLNDLPLGRDLIDWQSFSGVFNPTTVTGGGWETYWAAPYGFPVAPSVLASMAPNMVESYAMGYNIGFLAGVRGGAEYESLTGYFGLGVKTLDVLSAVHIGAIILIIIGNIESKLGGRRK